MLTFLSRRARSTLFIILSALVFLVFLHLCSSSLRDALEPYAPMLGTTKEPLIIGYKGKESPPRSGGTTLEKVATLSSEEGPKETKSRASRTNSFQHTQMLMKGVGLGNGYTTSVPSSTSQLLSSVLRTSTLPSTSATPVPLTGAIIAAVGTQTNLSWINEIRNPMWKLHRYNHDDPSPPPRTHFPANKGNEAMMYLSYVINNYDALPNYSIFIHGHRLSWHQEGDMVDIINNFRLDALEKAGYAPLRCDWYPSCPREIRPVDHDAIVWGPGVHREDTEYEIGRAWPLLFPANTTLPHTIASQCCAQFAVTRTAVLRRPKHEYERMRQWLLDTELINDVSGRVFEKLWAYIFTGESVRCPPPQQCACEFFGQCGFRAWSVPPVGLGKWPETDKMVGDGGARRKGMRRRGGEVGG